MSSYISIRHEAIALQCLTLKNQSHCMNQTAELFVAAVKKLWRKLPKSGYKKQRAFR